ISALDPAELFFQYMPSEVRIDRSDAEFVDVIHSDAKSIFLLGLGMKQACGHVDFYPNGAEEHPGCSVSRVVTFLTSGLEEGFRRLVACNHQRAVDFFISSINTNKCEMVSYTCPNYELFEKGRCSFCGLNGEYCPVMGLKADTHINMTINKHPLTAYLKTNSREPFCRKLSYPSCINVISNKSVAVIYYKIEIKLKKVDSSKDVEGSFDLQLFGENGKHQVLDSHE
ncbi:pancreatic triacylglycerol lipase-like protein, partial [Leptotrombidium deliense]